MEALALAQFRLYSLGRTDERRDLDDEGRNLIRYTNISIIENCQWTSWFSDPTQTKYHLPDLKLHRFRLQTDRSNW